MPSSCHSLTSLDTRPVDNSRGFEEEKCLTNRNDQAQNSNSVISKADESESEKHLRSFVASFDKDASVE